ncbi:MAG: hypothetical protein AAF652_02255 [Cyanobacteria bacterium P01_C01_bin.72]
MAAMLTEKITILSRQKSLAYCKNHEIYFSPAKLPLITYGCPLGLSLSASCQKTASVIVQELGNLMASTTDNSRSSPNQSLKCELLVEIVTTGWLNFYLDAKLIARWLERSPVNIQLLLSNYQQGIKQDIAAGTESLASSSLFFPQYIHARCCSLLRLGAREKLIRLSFNAGATTWQIEQPSLISWLDEQNNLLLTQTSELDLLEQLLRLSDSWPENHPEHYWSKLALNFSRAIAIFLAECRFLGEVRQKYPSKAIARLRLIALVRFWLEKILQAKLNLAAPQAM